MRKFCLLAQFSVAVTLSSFSAYAAELSRGWITINAPIGTCLNRARASFSSEKFPVKTANNESVFGYEGDTLAAIDCMQYGNKTVVFISVFSPDPPRAKYLRDKFYDGIRTGMLD